MICGQGFCVLIANLTHVSRLTNLECGLRLFCTVLPDKVYEKIRLRQCALEIATWHITFHEFFVLAAVLCAIMQVQGGCVQKSLLTELAFIRKTSLVCLQMIVHRILILLGTVTVRTHVETLCIFRVRIGHSSHVRGAAGWFNIFCGDYAQV